LLLDLIPSGVAGSGIVIKKSGLLGVSSAPAVTPFIDCTGLTGATASITSTYIRSTKLQASDSFTVDKIKATLSSVAGNVKFAIYSDDSDSPNALLATTGSKSALNGENGYALDTPYEVTDGTDYWISIQADAQVSIISGTDGVRANAYASGVSFGTNPDPYPSHLYDTTGFQFCISSE